jgi:hypothetical protein
MLYTGNNCICMVNTKQATSLEVGNVFLEMARRRPSSCALFSKNTLSTSGSALRFLSVSTKRQQSLQTEPRVEAKLIPK